MRIRRLQGNPVVLAVLRSPAHRLLSGMVIELRYTGRRSGRQHVLPVQYARAGDRLVVVPQAADSKTWWRNFLTEQPVRVRLARQMHDGRARVVSRDDPGWEEDRRLYGSRWRRLADRLAGPLVEITVWPDEAHTYLDGQQQGAPEALQGLQRALTSESRPLIAIGSMPRDRGLELMAEPKAGQHDPHRQARKLQHMRAFHQIEVPDDFSLAEPGELRELGRAADHDPRLATAQRAGGDRLQITQVLAGGLLMLDRYLHPTDIYSQAVITAAMDARRLGHSDALAPALLEEAVPGYLAADRRISSEHWFAAALDKAAEAVRGVRALTPTRRRPGIGDPDGYILHDYLDEYARTTREALAPPASLWDALLT